MTMWFARFRKALLLLLPLVSYRCLASVEIVQAFADAIEEGNSQGVKQILQKIPTLIDRQGPEEKTPLMHTIHSQNWKGFKALMENGADVTIPEETGYSPLDVATMMGSPRMVKMLLKAGADPLRKVQGWYPLHRACSGLSDDHTEIVEILLEHGVPHDLEGKAGKKCIDLCGRNYATYHEVMHRTMAELREGNKEEAENEF